MLRQQVACDEALDNYTDTHLRQCSWHLILQLLYYQCYLYGKRMIANKWWNKSRSDRTEQKCETKQFIGLGEHVHNSIQITSRENTRRYSYIYHKPFMDFLRRVFSCWRYLHLTHLFLNAWHSCFLKAMTNKSMSIVLRSLLYVLTLLPLLTLTFSYFKINLFLYTHTHTR